MACGTKKATKKDQREEGPKKTKSKTEEKKREGEVRLHRRRYQKNPVRAKPIKDEGGKITNTERVSRSSTVGVERGGEGTTGPQAEQKWCTRAASKARKDV